MRSGFKKLFIGFLFVFLKFHIIVDLLPDFIGYILIYNGIKQLATLSSQSYDKLKVLTIVLAVVSVPNFFLNDQIIQQSEWLSYYPVLLSLLKVILVYYLFDLLRVIAKLLPLKKRSMLRIEYSIGTWRLISVPCCANLLSLMHRWILCFQYQFLLLCSG